MEMSSRPLPQPSERNRSPPWSKAAVLCRRPALSSGRDPEAIANDVLVPKPGGGAIPLGDLATITRTKGPTMIRTEDGQLAVYVFVDIRDRDLGGYVSDARKAVSEQVSFAPGYYVAWSGQFEFLERAEQRMQIVIPATILVIFLLLFANFRRLSDTLIVMLSLPFSLIGGLWLMDWMGFNLSVASAVGFIALAGVAETGHHAPQPRHRRSSLQSQSISWKDHA